MEKRFLQTLSLLYYAKPVTAYWGRENLEKAGLCYLLTNNRNGNGVNENKPILFVYLTYLYLFLLEQ